MTFRLYLPRNGVLGATLETDMKDEKVVVILGTTRDDSNTLQKLRENLPFKKFELIELHKLKIEHFNYDQPAPDDFLAVAEKMTQATVIVFATPVYWYAMSGHLKVFFDRLTDLTAESKLMGRALTGKRVFLFATGTDPSLPPGFEVPFQKTSEYFGMHYERAYYVPTKP